MKSGARMQYRNGKAEKWSHFAERYWNKAIKSQQNPDEFRRDTERLELSIRHLDMYYNNKAGQLGSMLGRVYANKLINNHLNEESVRLYESRLLGIIEYLGKLESPYKGHAETLRELTGYAKQKRSGLCIAADIKKKEAHKGKQSFRTYFSQLFSPSWLF